MYFNYVGKTSASLLIFSTRCLQDAKNFLILEEHSKITFLEIQGGSTITELDLGDLFRITNLEIKSNFSITRLPPNLQHLKCDVGMLLPTTQLPDSLVSFHDYPSSQMSPHYSVMNRKKLADILKGETGCFIEKIIVDRSLDDDLFQSLSKRQVPLKELHYSLPLVSEEHAKILLRKVEKLTIYRAPAFFLSMDVEDSQLRSLTVIGFENFEGFVFCSWILRLQECFFDFCDKTIGLDHIRELIFLNPLLKKCTIYFPPFSNIERLPVVFKDINFSTHICFDFGLPDQYNYYDIDRLVKKARKPHPDFFIELRYGSTEVCIRRALLWIPPRHIDFCPLGKATLQKLVLGLTRLKKFSHLLSKANEKKEEKLVHVDPACIEWMLEGLKESDFYRKDYFDGFD